MEKSERLNNEKVDLKIFADYVEPAASDQILGLVNHEAFENCKIRIMPDVHAGAGCVVGFTANLGDKIVPNLVGVDIGCGMLAAKILEVVDFEEFDHKVRQLIPSGFSVHEKETTDVKELGLYCFNDLKKVEHLNKSLGTLGGGNHFIELNEDDYMHHWLVIHSGSRNLGLQVATIYQQKALETCKDDVPNDLKYLTGELAEAYLHDMKICQEWAKANREAMMNVLFENFFMDKPKEDDCFHTAHNYIGEDGIIRKGAISAYEGEPVLIPFNMKDGSVIGVGKGNEDWNFSAPHGAGRIMSRGQAKKKLSLDNFKDQMKDVWSTTVNESTLDESPEAYKPAIQIMKALEPTVEIKNALRPVYNFKA